ncbi:MAG: aldo/keto reductase [Planctomycetes bacterium]|nr:aldo/keto reductase [Planctomycetota bacterium]
MQYGRVPDIDKPLSRLVQGTEGHTLDRQDELHDLFDGVFELGCTTFDTAFVYGRGQSESVLGNWIDKRGLRDRVVIVDKGAHPRNGLNRVTPEGIAEDLAVSLERLKTDHVDLYLLHRDDPSVEVGPIVEALNAHREAGRMRAFGGSNWTAARVRAANDYAAAHGLVGFAASSPHLSLAVPREVPWPGCVSLSGPEGEADRRWYGRTGMPLFIWSSLAGGFLTGRFRRDNLNSFQDTIARLVVGSYCTEENFLRLDRIERAAGDLGLTISQVALAWLFKQPLNVFALVGCRTADECRENLAALDAVARLPDDLG